MAIAMLRGRICWRNLRTRYSRKYTYVIQTQRAGAVIERALYKRYRVVRSGKFAVSGSVELETNKLVKAEAFLNSLSKTARFGHGDVVSVVTSLGGIGPVFRHYALYDAWRRQFIEYQDTERGGEVVATPKARFLKRVEDLDLRVETMKPSRYTRGQIVARARSQLGENGYNLVSNNCESLVRWAWHNTRVSEQARTATSLAVPAVGVAAVGFAVAPVAFTLAGVAAIGALLLGSAKKT